jgi:sugar phosphate isomerase/epimerase
VQIAIRTNLPPSPEHARFAAVRELGAEGIELTFGPHDYEHHALWRPGGPASLRLQARENGVAIPSVFAGYVLDHPLTHADSTAWCRSRAVLERLLDAAAEAEVSVIVLPLLGAAEPSRPEDYKRLGEALAPLADRAARARVSLALQTLLPASEARALVSQLAPVPVKLAFDVGMITRLDRDAVAEARLLGELVCQVRFQYRATDRRPVGAMEPLGCAWAVLEFASGEEPRAAIAWLRRIVQPS